MDQKNDHPLTTLFSSFARHVAHGAGHEATFLIAVLIILLWGATGPVFGFSDTWQLVVNTGTTIVTFLMVFLIQNTQNRDSAAVQIKLDELIRATKGANTALLELEELTEPELEKLRQEYLHLAKEGREDMREGLRSGG